MRVYINKENKHKILVSPLTATHQDGYITISDGVVGWSQKEAIDKYYEPELPYIEPTLNEDTEKMLDNLSEPTKETSLKVTNKDIFSEIEKNAYEYYQKYIDGYSKDDFKIAVLPLMIYLSKHHTPMTKVIVENNKAELVEGIESVVNDTFVVD